MKIFISYPPFDDKGSPMLTQNRQFQWYHVPSFIYPMVPAMAATLLNANGFDVIWNDAIAERWDEEKFMNNFISEKPDIIAMETKTPVVKSHWKLIDKLKAVNPECKLVLMGDHVTALPEETMKKCMVDYVITGGNYDVSLLGIAKNVRDQAFLPKGIWYREDGAIKNTGVFDLEIDLNQLPFIDRKLTKAHMYGEKWKRETPFYYTMAGRDCPWGKCGFCSWTTTYPTFNIRRPGNLLDEIGFLIREHGAKEIFDDTGTFPGGEWIKKFCAGMIERGYNKEILFSCNMRFDYLKKGVPELMKKAGFRKIKSGLESANQKTLDRINKGIKVQDIIDGCKNASEAGIDVQLTVMVGYPWETRDDALRTLNLAKELMVKGYAEMLQATVLVPYPGTPLYRESLKHNWFRFNPEEYERYDMTEPVLITPDMEPDEVVKICQDIYKIFLSPKYIARHLLSIRSLEDISYLLRGARAITGHIKDFLNIKK